MDFYKIQNKILIVNDKKVNYSFTDIGGFLLKKIIEKYKTQMIISISFLILNALLLIKPIYSYSELRICRLER